MGCCGGGSSKSDSSGSSSGSCGSGGKPGEKNGSCGSDEFKGSDEQPVLFTPAAIAAIKEAIGKEGEAGDGLRVSVVGGGCAGYQYNLDFDKEARMGDLTLDFDGLAIYVDPISAGYLKGTVIDYVNGLNASGFKFNNPNAKRSCGCGSSFS